MSEKIIQRIDSAIKQINTAQEELASSSLEVFLKNHFLQDAISFSIMQVGERLNKLESLLSDKYPDLPWKSARAMRNIIAHDYEGVDFKKIYSTAVNDLPVLKEKLSKIKNDIMHISENSLYTKRLILRPWDDFDADELFELAKEPEIGKWCGWKPHKHIRDSFFTLHNFLEVEETYAICLKENNKVIGSIGLHFKDETDMTDKDDECELGYWIGKPYWNNGYATEAAKEIIRHAFEDLNVTNIWCGYYDGNEKSKHVQEKLGFVYHHTTNDVEVRQLNENRVGHVSVLSKETWE